MVNIKTLLPDLKELVKELDEDLLARATGNAEIDAGLREAFPQIEKGGRTAQAYEVWREDYLDQVAVAWVLACVFVRFMEDNHLIDECWLAGEGSGGGWRRILMNSSSASIPTRPIGNTSTTSSTRSGRSLLPRTCSPRGRPLSGRFPHRVMRR